MASMKRLVKASEKQVSSKQSTTNQKLKTREATAKESPQWVEVIVAWLSNSLRDCIDLSLNPCAIAGRPYNLTRTLFSLGDLPSCQTCEIVWPRLHCLLFGIRTYKEADPPRYLAGKFPHDSELEHLPYDLWTKFFGKRGPMTQDEFSKAFEDLDFNEEEVVDNVKCCIFYFLEPVLLGGDKKRLVRNDSFNMIQNDDATIAFLRSRIKLGLEVLNYNVIGFSLACQLWGFEIIIIVAIIGPCGKYHGSSWIPRILAWSYPSILQYSKLATSVFDRNDDASQSEFQHISRLKMQIEEMRSELVNIRTEMREEIQQQRNEVQNLSSLVCQLPLSAILAMPTIPIWDPFTPIDPVERAPLSAFINDPSTTVHPGDYDALEKSSFELIMASGVWLGDLEKEMKDSPLDMYVLGMLLVGSKSWLDVDYVDVRNRAIRLYDPDNAMTQDEF
ncbi:hypothetical protein FNV43_RR10460 [Rhamnella rubrinervis]|uniref:Uncharacterized protein n=1 Tax=Rhamnella rubrinervis TaxID=2594499 RepID=A0A8K0HD85_9ROSA|nr:hypothetical protein FNV43_RR10460 [Rhamnella rubrinervis]